MAKWESACLRCDPFAGDFDGCGSSDRVLSDKIVTVRKRGECSTCAGTILEGERARSRTEVYDGELMRARWCEVCSRAMAAPDEKKYERRIAIGAKARALCGGEESQ